MVQKCAKYRKLSPIFSLQELKQVVTRMGEALTAAEADELFREADLDGDGKLDYNEFVKMMTAPDI